MPALSTIPIKSLFQTFFPPPEMTWTSRHTFRPGHSAPPFSFQHSDQIRQLFNEPQNVDKTGQSDWNESQKYEATGSIRLNRRPSIDRCSSSGEALANESPGTTNILSPTKNSRPMSLERVS